MQTPETPQKTPLTLQMESDMALALEKAREEHFAAGLAWVFRDGRCQNEHQTVHWYADGRQYLVETLPGGQHQRTGLSGSPSQANPSGCQPDFNAGCP